jgi:hypothetical protein
MKTILFKLLTLFIAFSIFSPKGAQAESWGVLGGVHKYTLVNEKSENVTPDATFSNLFGIALYHSSYPLELDILYTSKKFSENTTEKSLQFPIFYRANITKEFKFGVGVFFDYNMSDETYRQKLDMGLAASLQYQYPMGKGFLELDVRYLYGNTELPGKSRDINLLVGYVLK